MYFSYVICAASMGSVAITVELRYCHDKATYNVVRGLPQSPLLVSQGFTS
eukprot:m.18994 g.18994  ORF g.18994 m.18994 type:complete len:50 (+) comp8601_c0_seq1:426-575(+)